MKRQHLTALLVAVVVCACTQKNNLENSLGLAGTWVTEPNGDVMLDPQTSGLKAWRGKLVTVSDGSAHVSQRRQLHILDPANAQLAAQSLPIALSARAGQSCFAEYLLDAPDYEALAIDPDDDRVFILVTEDASRSAQLSGACLAQFADSGSTQYPTLLVRLELQSDNTLLLTHVRPIQYAASDRIGNFPNDGVEGMAIGPDHTLYLAVERDIKKHARIFSLKLDDDFWQDDAFAAVTDEQLDVPFVSDTNHPINGMDYLPVAGQAGYLIAAARNDDQLWIIDLSKQQPTKIIDLHFLVPTAAQADDCAEYEVMDNASLEGVAVDQQQLFLINDPWRENYLKNVQCESNRSRYEKMAPLLFSLPIDPSWTAAPAN